MAVSPVASPSKPSVAVRLPLRFVLIVPFMLQISVAVGLTAWLSLRNGQKAVNDVATQLRREVSARTEDRLQAYLEMPHLANRLNADALALGQLDMQDIEKSETHFLKRLRALDLITETFVGMENGVAYGAVRDAEGKEQFYLANDSTQSSLYIYAANEQGKLTQLLNKYPGLDLRQRPWYLAAKQSKKPIWTEVFLDFASKQPAITAAQPVYDSQNQLLGVMGSSLFFGQVNEFLRSLKVGKTGQVFIMERSGNLISTSVQTPAFKINGEDAEPIPAFNSENYLIRETAKFLRTSFGQLDRINESQQLEFDLKGKKQFLQVSPLKDERGLDWLIVVVVPESDFMEQIHANTRNTIWLCLAALTATTILGIYTSRWIVKPVMTMKQASEAIASGQLDQTVDVQGISELESLAQSFNQMTDQLNSSFSELETRVEERTIELKQAMLLADSANQAKSEFLANMSHELRTPLNGILGYAQILERSKSLAEKERHGVSIIYQCGSHLLTLINDILDLSKIEARKLELAPTALHLPAFLQGVVEICRVRADQKGIDFEYQPDLHLPDGIEADEKRLRQVLINLLGNAIKFTDRGTVTFKVMILEKLPSAVQVRFQIEDTGVGIAPDQVGKIFQEFEQVGEQKRQSEGTGLGLAISQKIVELMGSHIQVKSQLGVGSDFFFEVELPLATDWLVHQSNRDRRAIVGYEGPQRHILVVDDHWENRSVIVNLLQPLGFQISEAENGQEGLNKIAQLQPDLTITDLAMPTMDGFEMLNRIRQDEHLKHHQVIVSSASVAQLDQQMSLDAGGDDFLVKPVQADELLGVLEKFLSIQWKYEEEADSDTEPIELIAPPLEDLQKLLDLSRQGRLKKLIEESQQIAQQSDRYLPFTQKLIQLANQFQSEKIETLLQDHLADLQG
jgi:signal transduction histidine kinase/FixJ family two-component response regulator